MDFLTQLPIESNSKTIFIALFLVFVALLYWYSVFPYTQLERIGVKHPKPWPFFGNMFFFQKGFWDAHQELIRKYGRVCGYYLGRQPVILVSDPDMIKQILIKDFNNFPNRTMVPLINIAADTLVENLKVYADSGQSFNVHKCLGCFTMDVIASVAFGTQVNSQKNPDNPFVKHAQTFFSFTFFRPLVMLFIAFPFLISPLIWIVPNKQRDNLNDFFISFIKNIIKERDNQSPNERRRDFLQLMLDARNSTECASLENFDLVHHTDDISGDAQTTTASKKVQKTTLTEDEIMGQGLIFLLAGYETTSSTLAFACYMLAIYQDCQKMVIKEVDDFFSRHEVLDYNNVQELPYLDQVISETLRLFPPGFRFARDASRDCVVNGQFIPRGVTVEIPAGYIHYNPEYWPEPEKFIPERFTQEAKAKRHPFTYLPFGAGPRSCIAMRLALLEVKIAMVRLLQQYTFETCPDTKIPVELKSSSTLAPKDGIFLKIVHRYK
ncbi:thromboxane-A synthase isoform X2 [Erpetoichthys calabaricus]|uniref:thromboxane-A synthase isoform X2 n=1 Tax=Erpetoichthys calabaricus TaxID=27687 RepID=UPI002234E3CC|nr:thromboxane-A synthase isoform X2 [Erpetoichthys calabaricus]